MASLEDNYPVYLNGVQYEPFGEWEESYDDSINTHVTEGGSQEDVVTRRGRRIISVSTTCLGDIAHNLALLQDLNSFTVKFYDLKLDGYAEITMRIPKGSFSAKKKKRSERIDGVNGIWTVSFRLEEY